MLDNEGMNNPVALKWTELFLFLPSAEKPHRGEIVAFFAQMGAVCLQLNKDGR